MYEVTSISSSEIISKVTNEFISLWNRVNPKLPLIRKKSVAKKISRHLKRVLSAEVKCGCEHLVVACNNRSVKCKNPLDCKTTHFACLCESGKKVPPLDRL